MSVNFNVNRNVFIFSDFNFNVDSPGLLSDEQRGYFLVFILLAYVVVWIYHSKQRLKWIILTYDYTS